MFSGFLYYKFQVFLLERRRKGNYQYSDKAENLRRFFKNNCKLLFIYLGNNFQLGFSLSFFFL